MKWFAMVLAAVILVSGCISTEERNIENVTVKLKWIHQSQFAGNYVAKERGFYEEEGLNVSLVPFSFENPTIEAVVNGDALFGVTGADEIIVARASGKPVRAFAVIYKINPVCAYSLNGSGIKKPQDFIGKTVGLERETNVDTLYYAMMSRLDINRSKINEVSIGYDAGELLRGETDVSTGYVINEPNQAIEEGRGVNIILMADYGVNMYADVLFTTDEIIEKSPEVVEGFARATIRGWQYAIENEGEAVEIVLGYAADSTRSHEEYMLSKSVPLINTGESPIGWMEKEDWQRAENILRDQGMIETDVDISDVYTMEFLNKIYG